MSWQDFFSGILVNLISSAAWILLGGLLVLVVIIPIKYVRRRRFLQFFGITQDNPKLIVYFSTVFVKKYGSEDFKGTARSFSGPATPDVELRLIDPLGDLFSEVISEALPNWLISHFNFEKIIPWELRPISFSYSTSPKEKNQVELANAITIGSQYYNSAGDLHSETYNPLLKLEQVGQKEKMVIRVSRGERKDDVFEPREGRYDDLAVVEKLYSNATKRTVFITAGVGNVGTVGAVHYLIDNWSELMKKENFGLNPFAVCLRFHNVNKDPEAYKKPHELSRFKA